MDDVEDPNEEAILLHYYSPRGDTFSTVVSSMVKEIAKNSFGLLIRMDLLVKQGDQESPVTTWRITLDEHLNNNHQGRPVTILRHSSKKSGVVGLTALADISEKIHGGGGGGIRPAAVAVATNNNNNKDMSKVCPFHKGDGELMKERISEESEEKDQWVSCYCY